MDSFEKWKRCTVRTVHTFSSLCVSLTSLYAKHAQDGAWSSRCELAEQFTWFRATDPYKARSSLLRSEVASVLRSLRLAGLSWRDVRKYRERILTAPFSRGGVAAARVRREVASELQALLMTETEKAGEA